MDSVRAARYRLCSDIVSERAREGHTQALALAASTVAKACAALTLWGRAVLRKHAGNAPAHERRAKADHVNGRIGPLGSYRDLL